MNASAASAKQASRASHLNDMQLLNFARAIKGNDSNLARFLGRSPAAISQWRKARKIPMLFRRLLLLEMGLQGVRGPLMDEEFRVRQEASTMLEQIFALFVRTNGKGEEWTRARDLLNALAPLSESDVRIDWVLLRTQLEEHRAQARGSAPSPESKGGAT